MVRDDQEIKGVAVNGKEQKIGLFADDVIAFLQRPYKSLPRLMKLVETFGDLSGYKINISKTQILGLNYSPPKKIEETFNCNWKLKKIEYLGVIITKGLTKLYKANYSKINQEIQNTKRPLDFSSRTEINRMNVLPRLLYLFQSPPNSIYVLEQSNIKVCLEWGKNPRVRLETLQLPKERGGMGGMGMPNLKEYFNAAQIRYIVCWCKPDYTANWKMEMEKEFGGYPVQSIIGDKELYKKIKQIQLHCLH